MLEEKMPALLTQLAQTDPQDFAAQAQIFAAAHQELSLALGLTDGAS